MSQASSIKHVLTLLLSLVLLSASATVAAVATIGTARGTYSEVLNTQKCGAQSFKYPLVISLQAGHRWHSSNGGSGFSGTFSEDLARRNFVMSFDSASKTRFLDNLARWAGQLCGGRVRIKSISVFQLTAALNTSRTVLTGRMLINGVGANAEGQGSASYRASFSGKYSGK